MTLKSIQKRPWLICALSVMLCWACSSTPLKVTPVAKTDNPAEMITALGKDLAEARTRLVDMLSPNWFQKAVKSYNAAKEGLDKGAELSGILNNIAEGRAQLKQAEVVAIRSRDQLEGVVKSREAALAVNARQFKDDFADADSNFVKLSRAIEDGKFESARSKRDAVSAEYRNLELRAISLSAMGDVRQLMQKAQETKVPKIAPKAYADAQAALADAEKYISQNRYNEQMIAENSAHARFMAQRALAVGQASRKIEEMKPESIALWIESFFVDINKMLDGADRRNVSFKEQTTDIIEDLSVMQEKVDSIKDKDATIKTLQERLAELEGTSQKVKYDKERLAAEKRFNEQFIIVQGYFDTDEAEVYKQYNTLVIRLKGIQFPVGQSVIQPASYPLLSKVQRAIKTFGNPDVVIEGHTDSTGSARNNQILSTARAESVKTYLVANGTLSSSKISAVGHGSSRPIAPNETAKGRAQNRRIDVIIKPRMSAMQ